MRIFLWAFIGFLFGAIFLTPMVSNLVLPDKFYFYAPLAIMACMVLIKVEAVFFLKRIYRARQMGQENENLDGELKEAIAKLHQEKKAMTEHRTTIANLEKEVRRAKRAAVTFEEELNTGRQKVTHLETALQDLEAKNQKLEKATATRSQAGSEQDVLHFVSRLQEKGRIVDFIMDDVSTFNDQQIGAAARIVHQGCTSVLKEYFDIDSLGEAPEGQAIKLDENYDAQRYRLIGEIGEPPFEGRLIHRGWLAKAIRLPKAIDANAAKAGVISPAQIELN